jgi:hypothetical protein
MDAMGMEHIDARHRGGPEQPLLFSLSAHKSLYSPWPALPVSAAGVVTSKSTL